MHSPRAIARTLAFTLISLGSLTAEAQLRITTQTLPPGRVGDRYSATLRQSGGVDPVWSIIQGQLAPGLIMTDAGTIEGTPVVEGDFAIRVEADDGSSSASASFVLSVASRGGLTITTTRLPEAHVGTEYRAQLAASGGSAPYAFQAISGAPEWMFVSGNGAVSGTPSAPGSFDVALSVFDSGGNVGSGLVRIEVTDGMQRSLEITTRLSDIPRGTVGVPYSVSFRADGGSEPYRWTISDGSIPNGLVLASSTGVLSGTPSGSGEWTFEITVLDANEREARLEAGVVIGEGGGPGLLRVTLPATITLPFAQVVDYALTAEGGQPPYAWSNTGALPPGLRIEGAALRGTPTTAGAVTVNFFVMDATQATAQLEVTLNVSTEGGGGGGGGGTTRGSTTRGGTSRARAAAGCTCTTPAHGSFLPLVLGFGLILIARRRR